MYLFACMHVVPVLLSSVAQQQINTAAWNAQPIATLIAAVIAAGASLALGIINLCKTNKVSKAALAARGITDNRVKWIQQVRETAAEIGAIEMSEVFDVERDKELLKYAYKLYAYLNPVGVFDKVIEHYLVELVNHRPSPKGRQFKSKDYISNKRHLLLAVQIYLKAEWVRVKDENNVKKKDKYDENVTVSNIFAVFSQEDSYITEIKNQYEKFKNKIENNKLAARQFTHFVNINIDNEITFETSCKLEVTERKTNPSDKTPQSTHQPLAVDPEPTESADS